MLPNPPNAFAISRFTASGKRIPTAILHVHCADRKRRTCIITQQLDGYKRVRGYIRRKQDDTLVKVYGIAVKTQNDYVFIEGEPCRS